jgi:hypothetical protein
MVHLSGVGYSEMGAERISFTYLEHRDHSMSAQIGYLDFILAS